MAEETVQEFKLTKESSRKFFSKLVFFPEILGQNHQIRQRRKFFFKLIIFNFPHKEELAQSD